ncbi:helix-turn-helix domain-containing protein [Sphingomonas sp. PP-CC-3G-468]|uniref:helix-turn-helix domain-containing protein n=1 Tax=Sphingomonas sp. PP-CC-3G-468 TaxID=2135656 RepID=UPI00104A1952|nr:helix-turn-helix domain-containing protein [Sphingomonas sp. PP-CC-3G-468]
MYYDNSRPIFAFSTMCMILLRECRHERRASVELIADRLNVPSSTWEKAEAALIDFDFNLFCRACDVMQLAPSWVIHIGERYVAILRDSGWDVLFTKPKEVGRDDMLRKAKDFWKTDVGQGYLRESSIMVEPDLIRNVAAPLFRYALDPSYQELLDNPIAVSPGFSPTFSDRAEQGSMRSPSDPTFE